MDRNQQKHFGTYNALMALVFIFIVIDIVIAVLLLLGVNFNFLKNGNTDNTVQVTVTNSVKTDNTIKRTDNTLN